MRDRAARPENKTPTDSGRSPNVKALLSSKYEIVESLGKGEVCTVYRAIDRKSNIEVALEILPPHLAQNEEYVNRFHREAHIAARLNNRNISKIYEEGIHNGVHFVTVEFLDGIDLHTMVMWKGRLETKEATKIIGPIIEALAYAHDKGLIHRDIRSSNIIITDTGRPVLTDFWIDHSFRGTKLIGALEYMSPEQAEGKEPSRTSNIYSLGIVLYEALTGKVPFSGGNPFEIVSKIIGNPPVLPRKIAPDIPTWIEEIVLKCLAKNSKDRFSSAAELAAALMRAKYPVRTIAPQPSPVPPTALQPKEKKKTRWMARKRKPPVTVAPSTRSRAQILHLNRQNTAERHETVEILPPSGKQIEIPPKAKAKPHRNLPTKSFVKISVPLIAMTALVAILISHPNLLHLRIAISIPESDNGARSERAVTNQAIKIPQKPPVSPSPPQAQSSSRTVNSKIEPGSAVEKVEPQKKLNSNEVIKSPKELEEHVANIPKTIPPENRQPIIQPKPLDKVERVNLVGNIQWVFVEGGTFQMGSNNFVYTKPIHSVKLQSFYMSATEITFDQYDRFCDATHMTKPSDNGLGRGKMPVVNVSWNDAVAYCRWVSDQTGKTVRLPTEAEYEYAARGGNKSGGHLYSGTNNISDAAWYADNSSGKPHEVGTKAPNELGLFDMSGNIWEWCEDWFHQSYDDAPADGGVWNIEDSYNPYRVLRGGSANGASYCSQVSFRFWLAPFYRDNVIGFRCVRETK
jgi:formylglycine-generating enzyme required for sulfatase activity